VSALHDPWTYAETSGRTYITPEDIGTASGPGVAPLELWRIVLDAIARNACEDPKTAAFVALKVQP
jgi:hypothetical protein